MENKTDEQLALENFVFEMTDHAATKTDWLMIMRFGMNWFLRHQSLLVEVVVRRAEFEAERDSRPNVRASDFAASIFLELDLHFEINRDRGNWQQKLN